MLKKKDLRECEEKSGDEEVCYSATLRRKKNFQKEKERWSPLALFHAYHISNRAPPWQNESMNLEITEDRFN
jgi:hypothetical protein